MAKGRTDLLGGCGSGEEGSGLELGLFFLHMAAGWQKSGEGEEVIFPGKVAREPDNIYSLIIFCMYTMYFDHIRPALSLLNFMFFIYLYL